MHCGDPNNTSNRTDLISQWRHGCWPGNTTPHGSFAPSCGAELNCYSQQSWSLSNRDTVQENQPGAGIASRIINCIFKEEKIQLFLHVDLQFQCITSVVQYCYPHTTEEGTNVSLWWGNNCSSSVIATTTYSPKITSPVFVFPFWRTKINIFNLGSNWESVMHMFASVLHSPVFFPLTVLPVAAQHTIPLTKRPHQSFKF